jgi:hypothetical protein
VPAGSKVVLHVALALVVAGGTTATAGSDFDEEGVQAAAAVGCFLALLLIGVVGGARVLVVFALAYVVAAVVHTEFFWSDDPTRSGTDDLDPMAGIVVVLPFALLVVAMGVVARYALRRERERRPL